MSSNFEKILSVCLAFCLCILCTGIIGSILSSAPTPKRIILEVRLYDPIRLFTQNSAQVRCKYCDKDTWNLGSHVCNECALARGWSEGLSTHTLECVK